MKNYFTKKALIISIMTVFPISLLAKTEGKKVKIFTSSANEKQMLVEQPEVVFQQDLVIDFGKSGIGYNFCRTHINACDFSIDEYTYVEDGDVELKTFNIDRERKYNIPMIRAALKVNPNLWLFASPWSPPAWMKDNKRVVRGGRLLDEYYPTWAKYFSFYLKEFKKEGIDFFAVTIQNEPKAVQGWESCIWTGKEEGIFATNFLRHNFTAAAVAWNMMVDSKTGGPFHNTPAGGSSAPVWVDADKKEFILEPLFYTDGHFSKFIKRGAVRIGNSVYNDAVKVAAFSNPDGEIVVVVLNTTNKDAMPKLRLNNCTAEFKMPAKSLQTLIIPAN